MKPKTTMKQNIGKQRTKVLGPFLAMKQNNTKQTNMKANTTLKQNIGITQRKKQFFALIQHKTKQNNTMPPKQKDETKHRQQIYIQKCIDTKQNITKQNNETNQNKKYGTTHIFLKKKPKKQKNTHKHKQKNKTNKKKNNIKKNKKKQQQKTQQTQKTKTQTKQ